MSRARAIVVAASLGAALCLSACPAETPEQRQARLQDELGADEVATRLAAVKATAALGMDGAPLLREALHDIDDEVQAAAAAGLTALGPAALEPLHQAVKETPGEDMMAIDHAATALATVASPAAVRALFDLWRRDDVEDGNKASPVLGLGSRGGEAIVPVLTEGLADPNHYVQACCAIALGDTGTQDPAALAALRKVVEATGGKGYAGMNAEAALKELSAKSTGGPETTAETAGGERRLEGTLRYTELPKTRSVEAYLGVEFVLTDADGAEHVLAPSSAVSHETLVAADGKAVAVTGRWVEPTPPDPNSSYPTGADGEPLERPAHYEVQTLELTGS